MYLLTDDRDDNAFQKISFGGFPKRDIFTTIRKEILKGDPLTTARWVAEAHTSGWVAQLFELYETIAVQYVGLGNPRVFKYLLDRRETIRQLIQGKLTFLDTRNNAQMRYLLMEISMILLESQKRPAGAIHKLKEQDLEPEVCLRRLRFVDETFVAPFWDDEADPKNLKGVYNELFGSLRTKNMDHTMFWLAWLRMWEQSGAIVPSGDAPEECPVPLRAWFGWKVWRFLRSIPGPGLLADIYKMSCRDLKGSKKKFRDDCLVLACAGICDVLDASRPLTPDIGRVMSRADASVTDRVYREVVKGRDEHFSSMIVPTAATGFAVPTAKRNVRFSEEDDVFEI